MTALVRCLYAGVVLILMACAMNAHANRLAFISQDALERVKQQLSTRQAGPHTRSAYEKLLLQADKALAMPEQSVTFKGITPPSGSRHDYLSLSAYWWPDKTKKDGLPWVRHDGEVNPASKNGQSDGTRLPEFTAAVQALTLAWYFSGDARYADKAVHLLRVWFINPATRMNPNLNFAQGVPGVADGRNAGVLDGRYLSTRIIDALIMLRQAPGWTVDDEQQMRAWMDDYLTWLLTSNLGRREARTMNNHGNWYAVQVAGIAWYLDKPATVRAMVALAQTKLQHQLARNGSQPEELARTRSFHYSWFNLQALTLLAQLAPQAGAGDLWRYRTANGASLRQALAFMAPYSQDSRPWPYPSLDRISVRLIPLLSQADNALGTHDYATYIRQAAFTPPGIGDDDYGHDVALGAVIQAERDTWLLSLPIFVTKEHK